MRLSCILLCASVALAQDHGEEESKEMGPVSFMWPSDRTWGAAFDNMAPCGSVDQAQNRTEFPMREYILHSYRMSIADLAHADAELVNGQIALVMQDDAWKVEVSISHTNGMLDLETKHKLVI